MDTPLKEENSDRVRRVCATCKLTLLCFELH